ncbi:helix-turn-helix domain-containing protein [Zunongwangia sp. HGR-M22]|uniref:helix-turn-helix domain-containing protein n=1 Tax=Zunongwangia sp. HGR-M22 TaxID=3015168 RepID=UPI0022DD16F3|nr:helix-turn-helix domain-containing protein [Zunongwangia sp. HGR-M22]WBL26713.1 helix-turn-helix domain-containing protein [Zunongwangia sp. HGR-M22]
MPATILTTDDLREFKRQLFKELRELMKKREGGTLKKYLKSSEVMDLLQISPGTLQQLRINGTLPFVKIKGLIYYEAADIQKAMDAHRIHRNTGFSK